MTDVQSIENAGKIAYLEKKVDALLEILEKEGITTKEEVEGQMNEK